MPVDNIPVPTPIPVTSVALEERRVRAMELHAESTRRMVDIQAEAGAPFLGDPKMQRFERILTACITGRVATDVEGFLTFTRELCDGLDREFPAATPN